MSSLEELQAYFQSHSRMRDYKAHSAKVHSVGWSCDGRRLASGSFDKSVAIFYLDKDRLARDFIFRGHGGSVDQLCWHASNSDLLATASGDKTVRIWDIRIQKAAATIITKGENINITWSPDGNSIAVGNKEDLITFIDARSHRVKAEEQFSSEVNEISWNKKNNMFFLTNGQGCIQILSYPDLEPIQVIKAHPGTCICIDFDPTGQHFATGSADALVSLWDAEELACVRTFFKDEPQKHTTFSVDHQNYLQTYQEQQKAPPSHKRLDWPVRTISFSYDGKLLASASEDLVIDIGEVVTGEKVCDIPVEAATFTVAWHPNQYLLAYACDDKDTYERKMDAGTLKVYGFPNLL